jgi:hypothetical protein
VHSWVGFVLYEWSQVALMSCHPRTWWMRMRSITITISSLRFPSLTTITTVPAPPASMSFLNALYAPIQCTPQSIRFVFFSILLDGFFVFFFFCGYSNISLFWSCSICFQPLYTFYFLFFLSLLVNIIIIIIIIMMMMMILFWLIGLVKIMDFCVIIALGMLRLDKEQNVLPNRINPR